MNKTGLPDPEKPVSQNLIATPSHQSSQQSKNKEAMLSAIKRRLKASASMK